MRRISWPAAAALVALALAACADTDGSVGLASYDAPSYAGFVHAILEARCATLDCHGDPGRPLRLYSGTGLRLVGVDRALPVTAAELDANLRSIAAVDPGASPAEHLLVAKPLDDGLTHEGGDLWSAGENQVVCVRGWLAGLAGGADATVTAACQAALLEPDVMLPDP